MILKLIHSVCFEGGISFEVNGCGTKAWWLNGNLHREDGPAIEQANGWKEWWVNGKELTEEAYDAQVNS